MLYVDPELWNKSEKQVFFTRSSSYVPNSEQMQKVQNSPIFPVFSAQIEMVPQNYQTLDNEEHVKLMEKLIEIMEDDDDVQNIWHNWEE